MADNTTLNAMTGGDVIRSKDRTGVKTGIVAIDLNPSGAETLMSGAMPVTDNGGSVTVDAPVGTPVFVRLSDGASAISALPVTQSGNWSSRTQDGSGNAIDSATGDPGLAARGLVVKQAPVRSSYLYIGSVLASAAGASKNHLTIYNADATKTVEIIRVYVTREITAAVTGLIRGFRVFRFTTAHSAGLGVTPRGTNTAMGALSSLSASITLMSNSTIGGAESEPLAAVGIYEEETGGGVPQYAMCDEKELGQPVVLNQNEGLAVQQDSTAGTGTYSVFIVFRVR